MQFVIDEQNTYNLKVYSANMFTMSLLVQGVQLYIFNKLS